MDDRNKCDSPRGSKTDSLFEKLRFEVTKKSDEDLVNIKKLTIQASNKSRESSQSNCDIDKKISDLECLIMRLQEELNDLSCANKQKDECKQEDKYEADYCCPVVNECEETLICPQDPVVCSEEPIPCSKEPVCCTEEPIVCTHNNMEDNNSTTAEDNAYKTDETILKKETSMRSASQRYPIVLTDIGHVQEQDEEDLSEETVFINNESPAEDTEENTPNVEHIMSPDWEIYKEEIKEESKPDEEAADTESLTTMIAELRAEIDQTLHTLNNDN